MQRCRYLRILGLVKIMAKKKIFPSKLEIELLVKKYKDCANERDKERALKELIYKLSYIPQHQVRRYSWTKNTWNQSFDDVLQSGYIALIQSIKTFDCNKCDNFEFWIKPWVSKSIGIAALKEKTWADRRKDMEPIESVQEQILSEEDIEGEYVIKEDNSLISFYVSMLDRDQREVVKRRFGFNKRDLSIRETAKELNMSEKKVIKIERAAVLRLKSMYQTSGRISTNI